MDLDLDCIHLSLYLVLYAFIKSFIYGISKVRDDLSSLCIICSFNKKDKIFFGQVHYENILVPGQISTFAIPILHDMQMVIP